MEPRSNPLSVRKILITVFIGVLALSVLSIYAWRKLDAHVNSPAFKSQIENQFSEATNGLWKIGALQSHLSFYPWISAHDIQYESNDNQLSGQVNLVRVDLEIAPLIKDQIVISEIRVQDPNVTLRKFKGGEWPSFSTSTGTHSSSRTVILKRVEVHGAQLTCFDANRSTEAFVRLWGDGSLDLQHKTHDVQIHLIKPFPAQGRMEIKNGGPIQLSAWLNANSKIKGILDLNEIGGSVSKVKGELFGGSIQGSSSWTRSKKTKVVRVSVDAQGHGWQLDQVLGLVLSTVTTSGRFNFDLSVSNYPWPMSKPSGLAELLDSLTKADSISAKIGSSSDLQTNSPIKNLSGSLMLNPLTKEMQIDVEAGWTTGHLQLDNTFYPARSGVESHPLQGRITVENLNLAHFPALLAKLQVNEAKVSGEAEWKSRPIKFEGPRIFSPAAEWTMDSRFDVLRWRNIPFEKVSSRVSWNGKEIHVEKMTGEVSQGSFTAVGYLRNFNLDRFRNFDFAGMFSHVEMAPFTAAFSSNPLLQEGKFSSTVQLDGAWSPWDPKSLKGKITLEGHKGHLRAGSFAMQLFSRLNLKSIIDTVTGKKVGGVPFEIISSTCVLKDGRVIFDQPFLMRNTSFEALYTGWAAMDVQSGQGVLIINALVGTRNLLKAIPGVSNLVLGEHGEFFPLVVDVSLDKGKLETNFRSVQTLTGQAVDIVKNVFKLPGRLFGFGKKEENK